MQTSTKVKESKSSFETSSIFGCLHQNTKTQFIFETNFPNFLLSHFLFVFERIFLGLKLSMRLMMICVVVVVICYLFVKLRILQNFCAFQTSQKFLCFVDVNSTLKHTEKTHKNSKTSRIVKFLSIKKRIC
jgi:hypothetical protein